MTRRIKGSLAAVLMLSLVGAARADINGFGDFSGFSVNEVDTGSPPTVPAAGSIELTNGNNESRSILSTTPQPITGFTASFTYQVTNLRSFSGSTGATFILENDPRGATAAGNLSGNNFGFNAITKSVGVVFDLYYNDTGLFTDGSVGAGEASVSPVNLSSGNPINVQLSYSGSTLVETLTDTVTSTTFSKTYLVLTPFATTVGASTAYVGISAGGGDTNDQFFSNFQFTSGATVPEPASLSMLGLAAAPLLIRRRRRTAGR